MVREAYIEKPGITRHFEDLVVWKKAMRLVASIYQITRTFPSEERFGLCQQLQRAAVSVPSNIAEGNMRQNTKEYIQFLYIARGSLAEVQTQLYIAYDLNYCPKDNWMNLKGQVIDVMRLLNSLIKSLKNPHTSLSRIPNPEHRIYDRS